MRRRAGVERARALVDARALVETTPDGRDVSRVLPMLFARRAEVNALGALRLWRIDQAMFDTTRGTALATVERAARWAGRDIGGGYPDLDWVLAFRGLRLNCWLLAMTLREARLPGPNPYEAADRDVL